MSDFIVVRNLDSESSLPFLVHVPIDGGLWFKTKEAWPRSARVYCHPVDAPPSNGLDVLECIPVQLCVRRGPAIDLILARATNKRSQFVFTASRGRSLILWQTTKVSALARPGARIPYARASAQPVICIDTREKYGYRFAEHDVVRTRAALPVGDYAIVLEKTCVAAVERKTLEDLTSSINDGRLNFAMAELAALKAAAVVVEGAYSALLRHQYTRPGHLVDMLARLQVRYPMVPIVFMESRKFAEEWTYRFLRAAEAMHGPVELPFSAAPPPQGTPEPKRRRARRTKPSSVLRDASEPPVH